MKKRFKYSFSLGLLFIFLLTLTSYAAAIPQDIKGHWAGKQVTELMSQEIITGYKDGTFKPDNNITRAEFVTLVNKAFGFTEAQEAGFNDVNSSDWFAGEIAKAKAAGYTSGYPDGSFKPNKQIQRQEAAIILANVLKLETATEDQNSFKDAGEIAAWSKSAVNAIIAKGLINGYPDKTFRPAKAITRAEVAVLLNSANTSDSNTVYDKEGTFGPALGSQVIDGNLIISASGVTVQNTKITGNLILDEAIGEGEVTLKNVVVSRNTVVKGGGSHSVVLENCSIPSMTVAKEGVRIAASGKTSVHSIWLETGAILEESGTSGSGIGSVFVSDKVPASTNISLSGNFGEIFVEAKKVKLEAAGGTIGKLEIAKTAGETAVNLASDAKVGALELNAAANVTGTGKIDTAIVNASGATLQQKPGSVQNPGNLLVTIDNSTSGSISGGTSQTEEGKGGGNNPLNFVGAFLSTINGNTSTTGDEVDGSSSIPVNPTIKLTFDRGVVRDNWENNQECITMQTNNGSNVPITVDRTSYTDDNEKRSIFVTPVSNLTNGKTYKIIISPNLMSNNDNTLGEEITVTFRVVSSSGGGGGGGDDIPAAPVLSSAEVTTKGDISLAFDKSMAIPSSSLMAEACAQFTVKVNGIDRAVESISSTDTTGKIKLTINPKITYGQSITVAYSKSANSDAQMKSEDGGVLKSFTAQSVNNDLPGTAPMMVSAATRSDGIKVVLTFNKPMADPSGMYDQFSVMVNDAPNTVTGAVYDNTKVELILTNPTEGTDVIKVSYTKGTVTSADGEFLESFSEQPVTNSLQPPVLLVPKVNNKGDISLTFDRNMAIPDTLVMAEACSQFTVTVDGLDTPVDSIESTNTDGKIKLVMIPKITAGQVVTIAYTKSENTDAQIKSEDGGALDDFTVIPVSYDP